MTITFENRPTDDWCEWWKVEFACSHGPDVDCPYHLEDGREMFCRPATPESRCIGCGDCSTDYGAYCIACQVGT